MKPDSCGRPWLLSGFFLLFFLAMALFAAGFSESARIMPLVVSVPAAILSTIQFVRDIKSHAGDSAPKADFFAGRPGGMLLALALLVLSVLLTGVVAGCGAFIAAFLVFRAGYRMGYALLVALCFSGLQYGVFTGLLDIELFRGLLLD